MTATTALLSTFAPEPAADPVAAAGPQPAARLVFGLTLDQLDALCALVRGISAHGDVVAQCGTDALDRESLPALGEATYTAGRTARRILDAIGEQRLPPAGEAFPEVPLLDRPGFARELHGRLEQASVIVQMLQAAARRNERNAEVATGCDAVSDVLATVAEALAAKFGFE